MSTKFNKFVQGLLAEKGYALQADGKDSKVFRKAIRDFQKKEGLEETETVTPETLEALREAVIPLPRPRPADLSEATLVAGDEVTVVGEPEGMVIPGNIDLSRRPQVQMKDGRTATVRSISIQTDDGEVLIPTVSDDGRIMPDDEAISTFEHTGRHLGVFADSSSATVYANTVSDYQASMVTDDYTVQPVEDTAVDLSTANSPVAAGNFEYLNHPQALSAGQPDWETAFDDTIEQRHANQSPLSYFYSFTLGTGLMEKVLRERDTLSAERQEFDMRIANGNDQY